MLTHPHFRTTLHEVETQWCLDDLCRVHDWLDALDDYMARQRIAAAKRED